jgi:CRISPR/Cas system CMR subunit Cmr4 (Cas7 group RAMP superfamily)
MGRLLSCRYVLVGDLVAQTPVHIGAAFGDAATDLPLARDGADRFYLPGTSLAGPIRRWWRRHWQDTEMFGRIPERNDGDEGFASHLVIDDGRRSAPRSSRFATRPRDRWRRGGIQV